MTRLYRNRRQGMVFGVCAGLADYFGFDVTVVRVLVVLGALFFFPMIVIVYLVLALLLPVKPAGDHDADHVDPVERKVRTEPHATLGSIRYRFRDLDVRLQRLEKYVTSQRFKLDREFRHLKDG